MKTKMIAGFIVFLGLSAIGCSSDQKSQAQQCMAQPYSSPICMQMLAANGITVPPNVALPGLAAATGTPQVAPVGTTATATAGQVPAPSILPASVNDAVQAQAARIQTAAREMTSDPNSGITGPQLRAASVNSTSSSSDLAQTEITVARLPDYNQPASTDRAPSSVESATAIESSAAGGGAIR